MSTLHLGTLAHLTANPFASANALEIIGAGALWVDDDGRFLDCGERSRILPLASAAKIVNHGEAWLLPGLIDAHSHFPQYYATAAYGGQLLDWLARSILPAELAYADPVFAEQAASRFIARLLACGTTTAMVFGSQFAHANEALFLAAKSHGIRLIAGATLMDLAGPAIPDALLQTVSQARVQAEKLIRHCQAEPLLHYAVTPRYAMSCSPEMMAMCADLLSTYPDIWLQTHINENRGEIDYVLSHHRNCRDYLEVYERFELITGRTLLAHNIHPQTSELKRIAEVGSAVCHCPSSNLYLGSGLFPLSHHVQLGIPVAMGTDIGAGTSFSLWRNLADAYNVQQMQGLSLDAGRLLYLATLGGASALRLEHETGNFMAQKSADFWVLDPCGDDYLIDRLQFCESWDERLFCLIHLAREQQVRAVYVAGKLVFSRG